MIRSLVLVAAVGLSIALLTLGAAAWRGALPMAVDPLPLAMALGLATAALTSVAAILASFRPSPHAIGRPR